MKTYTVSAKAMDEELNTAEQMVADLREAMKNGTIKKHSKEF